MHDIRQRIQDEDYSFPYHYVPQFHPGYTHTFSWPWGLFYASAMEYVIDQIGRIAPRSVMDVGTGDGRLVREMSRILPNARVAGVDYSKRAIQMARALNPMLDFRCLDITTESLGERFDVITLIEVLEHIPPTSVDGFITALGRLVNDGGYLLVTVPHENIPVSAKHFQHFNSAALSRIFNRDFVLEETAFLDRSGLITKVIRRMLENQYFILVHWGIRNRLYKLYKRFCLLTDERRCGRIFMRFHRKAV